MPEVEESKPYILFGVDMNSPWKFKSVNFYVFDQLFSPVEEETDVVTKEKYVVNLDDDQVIAQPFTSLDTCHYGARYVCVNNIIYRIGGTYFSYDKCVQIWQNPKYRPTLDEDRLSYAFSKDIDYCDPFDVNGAGCSWKEQAFGLKMNQDRTAPHLLVLGSVIFAVGGRRCHKNFLFMEMLNTNLTTGWVALPNPPVILDQEILDQDEFVSAALKDEGMLIFGSKASDYFYAYIPDHSSWERCDYLKFDSYLLGNCTKFPGVVIGGHSLWLDGVLGTTLVGLDLFHVRYFSLNLADEGILPSPRCRHYYPRLLHLGGDKLTIIFRDKILYKTKETKEEEESMEEVEEVQTKEEAENKEEEESEEEGSYETGTTATSSEGELTDFDGEAMEKKDAIEFGGFHYCNILVDFYEAHKTASGDAGYKARYKAGGRASGCVTVTSRRKLIGPSRSHPLSAALVMNFELPSDDTSGSKRTLGKAVHHGESSVSYKKNRRLRV